ncbi:chemotaxis protein CheW [Angustibacter aerolatus]
MTARIATFTLDGRCYGVPVDRVQEVLRSQVRTPVPLAPPAVAGLVNLRGQVLTAIDLRARLGLPERSPDREPMVVVVRVGSEPVSLLVDTIGGVVDVADDQFEPPPDTMDDATGTLIVGAYKLPDQLLLALDVDRAVEV